MLFFFLLIPQWAFTKPPALTPKDTRHKIEEILKAHVCHQDLTPELLKRTLQNFIEELDPGKTYFIESDISTWLEPSEGLLEITSQSIKNEDFEVFNSIHNAMLSAIQRRNTIEPKVDASPLPLNVQTSEFKDITWVKSEEELVDRLQRIKSLQLQTAQKIDAENQEHFFQRISKRRLNRESELNCSSIEEQKQMVLGYVLKAISSALDSQTIYFTPAEASQFMIQVQQRLFGIGAQLRDDLSGFSIVRIVEGGPASISNKLKVGDRIVAVDHEPVVGMDIVEAVELIRGPQGSNVILTVLRDLKEGDLSREEKLDIEIVRGEVVLKETRLESYYEPYGDGVIA
ncbi:MAG: PDZ domain-containing protein, partial [Chlamydiales bacterium]|nr:PDZ domain-containing protein [Chlamydiales bacterium]